LRAIIHYRELVASGWISIMHVRTKSEVLHEFAARGITVSAWARAKGFSTQLVYQVISGKKRGCWGQCHQIAVALGMKEGLIAGIEDLPFDGMHPMAGAPLDSKATDVASRPDASSHSPACANAGIATT
jgi:gp16 family phage-associated protein